MRLEQVVLGVGGVSVALAGIGMVRPRELAAAAGVVPSDDPVLPLLVRLNAARQGVLGLALLSRRPVAVRRSAELFLPLTALDAVAVVAAYRSGVVRPRSLAMALGVLATNAGIAVAVRVR